PLPVANVLPSGLNCTADTSLKFRFDAMSFPSVLPSGDHVAVFLPATRSHNFTALSLPPEASTWPSGLNANETTPWLCLRRTVLSLPDAISHNLISPLCIPVASILPSGLIAMDHTPTSCFGRVFRFFRPSALQKLAQMKTPLAMTIAVKPVRRI